MMIMLNLKKNSILFGQETQSKSVSGDAMQIHDFVKKKGSLKRNCTSLVGW